MMEPFIVLLEAWEVARLPYVGGDDGPCPVYVLVGVGALLDELYHVLKAFVSADHNGALGLSCGPCLRVQGGLYILEGGPWCGRTLAHRGVRLWHP